jgi:hypothetical protein
MIKKIIDWISSDEGFNTISYAGWIVGVIGLLYIIIHIATYSRGVYIQ